MFYLQKRGTFILRLAFRANTYTNACIYILLPLIYKKKGAATPLMGVKLPQGVAKQLMMTKTWPVLSGLKACV